MWLCIPGGGGISGGGILQTRACGLSEEMYFRSEGGGMPVGSGTPYQ